MTTAELTTPTRSAAQDTLQAAQHICQALTDRVVALQAEIEALQRDAEGQEAEKTALLKTAFEDGADVGKDRAAVEKRLHEIELATTRKREDLAYLEQQRLAADVRLAAANTQVRAEAVQAYYERDRELIDGAETAFRAAEAAWKALIAHRAIEGPRVTGRPFLGTSLQFQASVGHTFDGVELTLPCLVDIHGNVRV